MHCDCDPPRLPRARPIKILIVEGEFILAADLKETLEALGYVVTGQAASLIEALRQVQQDRPDVVLMAMRLQGTWNGIDTATLLWGAFHLPVIYLTGCSNRATVERACARLPFSYLIKPVREIDLVTAIHVAYLCSQANQS